MSWLEKFIPIMEWLPSYRKEWLRCDVVAGLTTAAVIIPQTMAYAAIAGLPLVVGLYTSLVMLVVYAALGTSRLLSVSTSSTIAILASGALPLVAPVGDAARLLSASSTLSLLVGAFLLLGGVLRLGAAANLISDPVRIGFKAGIGLSILLNQVPKLLGVHITHAGFFQDLVAIVRYLPETSLPTLTLALGMLGLMLGLKRVTPRLPAPLITVTVGIALSCMIGLDRLGISLVGRVDSGLPSFVLPDFFLVKQLWPAALGIALMSFVETAAAGRAFLPSGDLPPQANRELVATGLATLIASFFQSMPGGGGSSQTAINQQAGARSQLSGVVSAAVVVAALLFLAPLFGMLPNATLAVVVIVAGIGLISPTEFRAVHSIRTMEFHWALVAASAVMVLGTLKGLLVAVLVSILSLVIRANNHPIHVLGRKPGTNIFRPLSPEHLEDETYPGLLLLRPEGAIFFANAPRLGQKIRELVAQFKPQALVLDLSAVPDMEYTAVMMLVDGEEKARGDGTVMSLVALSPNVKEIIRRSSLWERMEGERIFLTLDQAVEWFERQLPEDAEPDAAREEMLHAGSYQRALTL
ncbi:SulP family inorganic anion transporter [Geomonas azotofigens]|uniref:SulP family inorganic anion transporter n=1 Tax=Geomonas azotofigens TaxID=2843196 RepID=UPI001C10EAF1|nr:SulP family inorganic anion transporter [Geomonas azotofigens]MBU5613902.1 SulP family inorganic anion transporter [Geomonas azotofigens]